jgi:predicted lipoprotein with Yx(FWY)xxD motif
VLGQLRCQLAPLLVTGSPTAGTGVKASKLATTRRSDGKTQVVYDGHPLYASSETRSLATQTGKG